MNTYDQKGPKKTVDEIAQEAADKALERVLLRLGIDPEDTQGLQNWRNDLFFLARMSRGAHQISSIIVKTCVGAAVLGIIWIVLQGFKDWVFLPVPGVK